jgi:D-methionine transport system permease protein
MSSDRFQELLLNATGETLYMVLLAALFTVAIG